jgi:GNAT superfamily N-acetyltransferase
MIPGFSREALLHEILIAPRSALVPLPDTRIIERPGWFQILTPSLTQGGMNEITATHLPEERADALIDAALAEYRALGLRFRWTLPPGALPQDLAERLARRGLVRAEALGMACLTAPALAAPVDPRVEEITVDSVDAFTEVMARGWQMDPAPLDTLHRRMLADAERRNWLFLARGSDGAPAAVASYVALERSAYLIGAVVLPAYRGQGLYRALVSARLTHAAARGLPLATSLARAESSAPILTRLGFTTAAPITVFSFTP